MKASVEVYAGRFDSYFDLTAEDGGRLDHDVEAEFTVKGIVKKVTLDGTRSGELRLYYVIHPQEVRLSQPSTENYVEIGGQVMTQAQFDAPRYPLLATGQVDLHPQEEQLDDSGPSDQDIRAEAPLEDDVSSVLVETPRGTPVSTVQPHSNVAGSSQAERDSQLAAFLYGDT